MNDQQPTDDQIKQYLQFATDGKELPIEHLKNDVRGLACIQAALSEELKKAAERKAGLQRAFDKIRIQMLPSAMEALGDARNVTFEGIGRITLQADAWVSVPAELKAQLHEWLISKGFSGMVAETVNAGTLKAWTVKRLKTGDELPEFLKITPFTYAKITPVGGKGRAVAAEEPESTDE